MPEYLTASPAGASHRASGQNLASQDAEIIPCNELLCFGSSGAYLLAYSCTVLFLSCHTAVIIHARSKEQAPSNLLRKKTDLILIIVRLLDCDSCHPTGYLEDASPGSYPKPLSHTSSRINPLCPWAPVGTVGLYSLLSNGTLPLRATPITQLSGIQGNMNFCFNTLPLFNVHVHQIFKCDFHCASTTAEQEMRIPRRPPHPLHPSTAD